MDAAVWVPILTFVLGGLLTGIFDIVRQRGQLQSELQSRREEREHQREVDRERREAERRQEAEVRYVEARLAAEEAAAEVVTSFYHYHVMLTLPESARSSGSTIDLVHALARYIAKAKIADAAAVDSASEHWDINADAADILRRQVVDESGGVDEAYDSWWSQHLHI